MIAAERCHLSEVLGAKMVRPCMVRPCMVRPSMVRSSMVRSSMVRSSMVRSSMVRHRRLPRSAVAVEELSFLRWMRALVT